MNLFGVSPQLVAMNTCFVCRPQLLVTYTFLCFSSAFGIEHLFYVSLEGSLEAFGQEYFFCVFPQLLVMNTFRCVFPQLSVMNTLCCVFSSTFGNEYMFWPLLALLYSSMPIERNLYSYNERPGPSSHVLQ